MSTNPPIPKFAPERLNLWDRMFNRYKTEYYQRGNDTWTKHYYGTEVPGSDYNRSWIEHLVIDRLTGGVEIKRQYLT
jgi:hypothetical protein